MIGRFLGTVGRGTRQTYNAVVNQLTNIFVSNLSNDDESETGSNTSFEPNNNNAVAVSAAAPVAQAEPATLAIPVLDGLDEILTEDVVKEAQVQTIANSIAASVQDMEAVASSLAKEASDRQQAQVELAQSVKAVKAALGVVDNLSNFPIDADGLDAILTEEVVAEAQAQTAANAKKEATLNNFDIEDGLDAILTPAVVQEAQAATAAALEPVGLHNFPINKSKLDAIDLDADTEGSEEDYPEDPAYAKKQSKVVVLDSSEESSSEEWIHPKKKNQDVATSSTKRTSEVLGSNSGEPAAKRASVATLEPVALPAVEKQPSFFARNPKVTGALIGLGVGLVITAIVAASVFTFGGAAVTAAALAIVLCGCLGAAGLLSLAGALVPSAMNDKRKADEIRAAHTNNLGPVAAPKANKCCVRKPRRETLFGNPTGGPAVVTVVPDADVANMRRVLGTV